MSAEQIKEATRIQMKYQFDKQNDYAVNNKSIAARLIRKTNHGHLGHRTYSCFNIYRNNI